VAILKQYSEALRADWDGLVAGNCAASYGHLSANAALAGSGIDHSIIAYEDGTPVAVLPLYEVSYRRLRAISGRALISGLHFPAGPLFAPDCSTRTRRRLTRELLEHVDALAARRGVDRIRIAYPNVIGRTPGICALGCLPLRDHGYHDDHLVSRLLPLTGDTAGLREQLRERGRRWLRKAEACGVQVRVVDSTAAWEACYPLHTRTMGRLSWPEHVLDAIWREFVGTGVATPFVATIDGTVVTLLLIVHMNRSAYYWLGWNGAAAAQSGANYAALWRAILYAQQRGAEWFELGSDDHHTPKARNISFFKAAFGGQLCYSLAGVVHRRLVKTSVVNAFEAGVSGWRRWRAGRVEGDHDDS
jgi:hypothetical protein